MKLFKGQRFHRLTVLGTSELVDCYSSTRPSRRRRFWNLLCDCGKKTKLTKEDFVNGKSKSCGCLKKERWRKLVRTPKDLTNQRFGCLVAIEIDPSITPTEKSDKSTRWVCQCDCGNQCVKSVRKLNKNLSTARNASVSRQLKVTSSFCPTNWKGANGLNCGDRQAHPEIYLHYPPTPTPYPKEASLIVQKYLHLTEAKYWSDNPSWNAETVDERIDRLLRAAWIIVYRRQQGETFTIDKEKRYIRKSLRYAQTDVYWRHKIADYGGLAYDCLGNKKSIRESNNQ